MPLPVLDPSSSDVAGRHLLLLPDDVGHDEVEVLAVSHFPVAGWDVLPTTAPPRPSGGARGLRVTQAPPGVLRLSERSTLEGPWTVDEATADALRLPRSARLAYVVHAPVEREEVAVHPAGGDPDGLRRAFPRGLPADEEARTVAWSVAVARRLGGAVRCAPAGRGESATVLVPDPAAAVDLTVWTDIWLDAAGALAVMRQAVPRATPTDPPAGRRAVTSEPDPRAHGDGDANSDDPEPEAPAGPVRPPYAMVADLELDGRVHLEVADEPSPPPVIAQVPWAAHGALAYRVRWEPQDGTGLGAERPSVHHRVARSRATPLVVAVTRAVHAAVGGEITDTMDFVVDPADL